MPAPQLPLLLALFLSSATGVGFWVLYGACKLTHAVYAPLIATLQELCPPRVRGTIAGIGLLVMNILGVGVGTLLSGIVADALRARGHAQPYTETMSAFTIVGSILTTVSYPP